MLRIDAEFLHHLIAGRTEAEAMQADDFAVEAHVAKPGVRHAGFNRNAPSALVGQNFLSIGLGLPLETLEARHGNDAHAVAELFRRRKRVLRFASTGKDDHVELSAFTFRDVTAAHHTFTA